jgi:hypothetical protein
MARGFAACFSEIQRFSVKANGCGPPLRGGRCGADGASRRVLIYNAVRRSLSVGRGGIAGCRRRISPAYRRADSYYAVRPRTKCTIKEMSPTIRRR